ncbi:MAG: carbohydrate kinase family protein [Candidatus Saccharibacteria bacterium]
MTKFLQNLLTSTEPLFPQALSQLEKSTGGDGVDVRLIADITHKAHEIMRSLSLDPADTTAHELYLALGSYVQRAKSHELLFDADFTLLQIEAEVVSFNLIDIIESSHHELTFENRSLVHGQRALRGEIIERYINHPRTDETATLQLASDAGLVVQDDQHHPNMKALQATTEDRSSKPYILAIGDIFSDAFIKLDEKEARIDTEDDGTKRLSVEFGAKLPYERVDVINAVGPSPNSAVSFARLGLRSGLMTFIGDDRTGEESLAYLKSELVDTSTITVEKDTPSSSWYVLRYGADRTMLVKNEEYDYVWGEPSETPDWIYLSQISGNSWELHEKLLEYLQKNTEIKLAFQPGTFHFQWGKEKLADVYRRAQLVVLNREEAAHVLGLSRESVPELISGFHDLGVDTIVITDGSDGAYAGDGSVTLQIPNYPDPAPPFERTGAGDAFASTITAALAQGESLETALLWAPINSMSVVQKLGAQAGLLSKTELQKYLNEAPEWYHPKELN